MSNKLAIAEHLNDSEHKLFLRVYSAHNRSIGLNEREQYNLGNIKKIKRNVKERCLEVYFKNGEWFKYFANGTWG